MVEVLPVGSIIELKNNSRFMVIGYNSNENSSEKSYDYICCLPHVGIKREKSNLKKDVDYFIINRNEIYNVLFIGYCDDDFTKYMYALNFTNLEKSKMKSDSEYNENIFISDFVDFFEDKIVVDNKEENING